MIFLNLCFMLLVILVSAEIFTNALEHLGEKLKISEGVTGSIFAAIGSVVSEDQQEAQQLVFPVMMPIIVGFAIMSKAVNDPNSTAAVFGSIFPLTSPIVMMGRITYEVPIWQTILSMLLLVFSFLFFTWITAKIYRTGILMYGKRPGWKEMIKWGFRKS